MFAWLAGCCCEEASKRPSDFKGDIEQVSIFPESCVSYDPQGQNVTYASDVDGRWDYFCNFVDHSRGLKFCVDLAPNERRSLLDLDLQLEEGWHFVYGGDACTQGPGSLRFLEAMVRLKKRWPGRVHLLLGAKDMDVQAWTTDLSGDFDCRREELAHLAGIEPDQVSDEEVAKSCEDQLKPGGGTWEYLQLAQLAILLGDTLFIHGEILSGNTAVEDLVATPKHQELLELGVVPDEDETSEDVQAWVVRLNCWVRNQIRQWELAPSWDMPVDSWSKGPSMIQQVKLQ
mmetsp:Transcript_14129/g.40398  ORF Transcript_14129/g.40398 Transcript_14129/m.40398 type:complete len:287 (-) Transcript_14129:86-946(-)